MISKYEAAVRKLYQVNMWNSMKYGLENSEALYKLIGQPLASKPIIHIAGTNGKGSVAFKISQALRAAGYREGLFVSPHIASFRERMQINGEVISEEEVATTLPRLLDLCVKHHVPATFFELTTALAFMHFKQADAVVLEVGLGGRLDATNVITPCLSVITSIGLDHTRILGSTREEIALEKAGIMKPNVPVLVGPRVPLNVLQTHAADVGSPFHLASEISPPISQESSDFDAENSMVARAALTLLSSMKGFEKLDQRAIDIGVSCRPPCRFEEMIIVPSLKVNTPHRHLNIQSKTTEEEEKEGTETRLDRLPEAAVSVVLDVGHNPPALEQLLVKLHSTFGDRPLRFVLGMCRDKDTSGCLQLIVNSNCNISHIHFVQAQHPRAALPNELIASAETMNLDSNLFSSEPMPPPPPLSAESHDRRAASEENEEIVRVPVEGRGGSVTSGIDKALRLAANNGEGGGKEVVVICGSVFMMAEARAALGLVEPRDSIALMEVAGSHRKKVQDVCDETKTQ